MLTYFAVYCLYLFLAVRLETEWTHWLTLVLVPASILLIAISHSKSSIKSKLQLLYDYVSPERNRLVAGVMTAICVGGGLGALQLVLSRDREIIWQAVSTGRFLYAFPLAVALMMITAGFTEEFFFRGLLQSSLAASTRSNFWSIMIASVAFGLYHLPYAYLLESWPSHGNLASAFSEGVVPSIVLGSVFGFLYSRFRNLLVPVVAHSVFNAFWAIKLFL